MGDTKIEWTEKTWNPVRGCSVVSEGCRNCYAMTFAARFAKSGEPYEGLAYRNESGAHWTGRVRLIEEHLNDPLRWKKPVRVFVNSMSDLFHEAMPFGALDRIFAVMALSARHTFQCLTKRPERMLEYVTRLSRNVAPLESAARSLGHTFKFRGLDGNEYGLLPWPIPNVWLGVSVEDQKTADERIPLLLQTPAAVRWISAEPLLGPVDLTRLVTGEPNAEINALHGNGFDGVALFDGKASLDWVVVGGESGPKARPMHPDWARSLRDQCVAAGVLFFFKQWGALLPVGVVNDGDEVINRTAVYDQEGERLLPDCCSNDYEVDPEQVAVRFRPVGKKAAGRLLDGVEWSQYPERKAVAAAV